MNEVPDEHHFNRPTGCEKCTKECTIHLTQIINGQVQKVDMCATCLKAKQIESPIEFGLMDQLFSMVSHPSPFVQLEITCQACGYIEADFKKSGRLGCPYCYNVFIVPRMEILRKIHHDIVHKGKVPKNQHKKEVRAHIAELKQELKKLVQVEDYEGAARVRDEINLLNKELASSHIPTTVPKKKSIRKKKGA